MLTLTEWCIVLIIGFKQDITFLLLKLQEQYLSGV